VETDLQQDIINFYHFGFLAQFSEVIFVNHFDNTFGWNIVQFDIEN